MQLSKLWGPGAALAIGGFVGLMAVDAVAGNGPPPVNGCPKGGNWELRPLDDTIPAIDRGNFHDQNNDGFVCKFENPNKNEKKDFVPDWIVKDNTNKNTNQELP